MNGWEKNMKSVLQKLFNILINTAHPSRLVQKRNQF